MKKRKFMKNQSKKQQSENEVPEDFFKCGCCGRDVRKPITSEEIEDYRRWSKLNGIPDGLTEAVLKAHSDFLAKSSN